MLTSLGEPLRLLARYLRPLRGRVALLGMLLLGSIALQLVNPQVVGYFLDTVQSGGPESLLLGATVVFCALAVTQKGIAYAAFRVSQHVGWTATNAVRADLTRHCLRLDLPFHKRHTPGALIERVDGDVSTLENFLSSFAVETLGNALLVLGVLAVLFHIDVRAGLGMTAYALLTFLALGALQRVAVGRWAASRQASADGYGFIEERIAGTEDIRPNGGEPYVMRQLYGLMRALMERLRTARVVSNLTFITTNFLGAVGYAVGLAIGAFLYLHGQISLGTAYLIVFYIGMVAVPLDTIREQVQDFQQAAASVGRVGALLRLTPTVSDVPGMNEGGGMTAGVLDTGPLAVELRDVSFSYDDAAGALDLPGDAADGPESNAGDAAAAGGNADARSDARTSESVLSAISLRLEPGQVLGLLGRTGSGKSTLSRLLFRLYDPTTGAITLGGADLRAIPLRELRRCVGMVTQDVQLFQASFRDNLTFFDHTVLDTRIRAVLDDLGLGEWLDGLPAGLDTPLGPGGQGLSAGEAQLLAFARVFLRDPGLVVLDEASSRLDSATERLLERAVDRLLANRTAVVIAHRLRTVQRADAIAILEDGRLVEHGPRRALAADPDSRFAHLLRTGLEETLV
ncbi:MAG TPA: ABC transporter ATP-binding protein [Ktedonobacterales bacterium]